MSWRAFLLGLVLVVFMCWADTWAGLNRGYGWTTEGHFSAATVFLLVVLVFVINVAIKLVRRRWGLKQPELMLVWCMITVAAVFPTTSLFRAFLPTLGGPAYFAARSDVVWKDTSLAIAPQALLLSKDPKSFAVRQFYEGGGEEARIPWKHWFVPLSRWGLVLALFYLAIFFMCAILRRQWVEREHLLFPLARLPLDFTEPASPEGLLPAICSTRPFLYGFVGSAAFRLIRAMPVFLGGLQPWDVRVPFADVLSDTPLRDMSLPNQELWWAAIALAYLLPADVSLSIWFFYLFGRVELQTASWLGSAAYYGGSSSPLLSWQMAGSYAAFTIGALYLMRRHLVDVVRKAVGRGAGVDDSAEPVPFALAFWGLVLCCAGVAVWTAYYGARPSVAVALIAVVMCTQFVHARIVAQSGLYYTWLIWDPVSVVHSVSLGHALNPAGAVVAYMQRTIMMNNVSLAPAAIHGFRIGDVFQRGRRWLLPAMLAATVAALIACSLAFLSGAYSRGVLNFHDRPGNVYAPQNTFLAAHQVIERPYQVAVPHWGPLVLGVVLSGFMMAMRARFYWWPLHPIGLLATGNWYADRMWLPFLLGWLIKVSLMKSGGGRAMRSMRVFCLGFILADSSLDAVKTIVGAISGGAVAWW